MRLKKTLISFVMISGAMTSVPSYGAYELIDSSRYDVTWKSGEVGTRDSDVINGYGSDIPLELALKQILPPDWTPLFSDSVDKGIPVNWRGGRPWATVLQEVAGKSGLNIELLIGGNKALIQRAPGVRGKVVFSSAQSNKKIYQMESKTWLLEPGKYLSQNLRDWAQPVGWDVDWRVERDFIIKYPADFQGSLITAIREVIRAYREQGVMGRVKATEHPDNRLIVIDYADD